MSQLELKLQPRLLYSPENFVVHDGVRELLSFAVSEAGSDRFSILYIPARPRSGKTHFSLKLALELSNSGFYPIIIEGAKFESEVLQLESRARVDCTSVFIVDDIHASFSASEHTDSGSFVHFIEYLRLRNANVVLLSSMEIDELPVDDHVRSRLVPGKAPAFGNPSEVEMIAILKVMAKQRGVVIREGKLKYLVKRLPRDIPSLERYLDRLVMISDGRGKAIRYSLLGDAM